MNQYFQYTDILASEALVTSQDDAFNAGYHAVLQIPWRKIFTTNINTCKTFIITTNYIERSRH